MALLPPWSLDAVVAIGVDVDDNPSKRSWIGTGFLYGFRYQSNDDESKDVFLTYLVTNAHVLQGHEVVWVKFNRPDVAAGSKDFSLRLKQQDRNLVYAHPVADVAVAPIAIPRLISHGFKPQYFRSNVHIETVADMKDRQATEGDGVFLLGFPMNLVGASRHHAICRRGCIARIRDLFEGLSTEYLVDAMVFPGNSGGPVLSEPTHSSIEGTQRVSHSNLIGIVSRYHTFREVAVSVQTGEPRVVFADNSGLAVVISVDAINEAISQHPPGPVASVLELDSPV